MKVVKPILAKQALTSSFNPIAVVVTDETVMRYLHDMRIARHITEGTYNNYQSEIENAQLAVVSGPEQDISAFPLIRKLASGVTLFSISKFGARLLKPLDFRTVATEYTESIDGWRSGTPSGIAETEIRSRFTSAGVDRNVFNMNSYGDGLAWNPACCCAGDDFSGVPVKHLSNGFGGGGVAITKRHVLTTHHWTGHASQTSFTFLDSEGTEVVRTVIGQSESGNPVQGQLDTNPAKLDVHVYTLNEDLPATVATYPVPKEHTVYGIPQNWMFSYQELGSCMPLLLLNESRKVSIVYGNHFANLDLLGHSGALQTGTIAGTEILAPNYRAFGMANWSQVTNPAFNIALLDNITEGTSGSPLFFPKTGGGFVFAGLVCGIAGNVAVCSYPSKAKLDLCILSADEDAEVSTGLTVAEVARSEVV